MSGTVEGVIAECYRMLTDPAFNQEHPPGSNHNRATEEYGLDGPWCDMGQTHAERVAGDPGEHFASTMLDVADARRRGIFIEGADGGQRGDKVFFHWTGSSASGRPSNQPDHVERFLGYLPDGRLHNIGFNVGDRGVETYRSRANVLGFKRVPRDGAATPPPAPAPAPAPHGMAYPGHFIRMGSNDHTAVRYLQAHIGLVGKDVDGIFGPKTLRALRAWQRVHGISADGVAGPVTWGTLGS